jgi:Arc/MetJ-type ribon-helix-helix transcriptional regulator
MNVAISSKTQKLLEDRLKSGGYQSADDLVYAALEALTELESSSLDEETLNAIDRAEAQIDRGEFYDWKDVREQVRAKLLPNR